MPWPKPPNTPFHPTPLCGEDVGAILSGRISSNAYSFSRCGAGEWQPLGAHLILFTQGGVGLYDK